MKILQKVLWIWLFILVFSFSNCSLISEDDNCNCPQAKTGFLALSQQIKPFSYIRIDGRNYVKEEKDTTIFTKYNYWGFGLHYLTNKTAFQPKNKSVPFSFISSAYACNCPIVENKFYLKNVYPVSLKIYTLYDINNYIPANTLMNEVLSFEGVPMKQNKIDVETEELIRMQLGEEPKEYDILFTFNYNIIQNDSIKFRIVTEFNTGEIITNETPLAKFEN